MLRPNAEPRRWGLWTRLLTPVVSLALVGAAGLGVAEELSARREAELLVNQRGVTVVQAVVQRLEDRRRAKVIYAQLLADEPGLSGRLEQGDQVGLAQILVPLMARLGLEFIDVYGSEGQELMQLGHGQEGMHRGLVAAALSGLTPSAVAVSASGPEVAAATPIKGPRGIVGVLLVGAVLDQSALREVSDRDTVELAFFRGGRLVGSTVEESSLLTVLAESGMTVERVGPLRHDLDSFDFRPVVQPLGGEGGLLVALVPIRDLVDASRQRTLTAFLGTGLLLASLLTVSILVTRAIATPLGAMLVAARAMARGNFGQRVAASRIREVHELGQAVNELARQIEARMDDLTHQASHDALSNLPNRTLFIDRLEHALARSDRHGDSVAVLFLDLDNFKLVNDGLGRLIGDRLIAAVGERLQACLRREDTLARLGGDEFTVLLEDVGGVNEAIRAAERIREQLRAPFDIDGQQVFASASIGIALRMAGHQRPEELLRDADLAMYQAKAAGKGGWEVFEQGLKERAVARLAMENDLRQALERGELGVHYQPIVRLQTGRIEGVEALARWRRPGHGMVPPGEFIAVAEETGLIVPIGAWICAEACRQVLLWQREHPSNGPLMLSVNLSVRQLQRPTVAAAASRILSETGFDAARLTLEITESVFMGDEASTLARLQDLKGLGIRLAIDDFGSGFSSLNYLKRFPFDNLKIDQALVRGVDSDPQNAAIVRAVIALGRDLGLTVTAEGIETAQELAQLQQMGCEFGQGFLLARPVPYDELAEMLATRPSVLMGARPSH